MTIDWNLVANIAVPIVALFVGVIVDRLFAERPKVITYLAHASAITVRPPSGSSFVVHTHSIVLRNSGRRAAQSLRVGHRQLPNYSVYPDVQFTVEPTPGGGSEVVFQSLGPREQVTISYLYYPPVTWQDVNTHVKSEEGPAHVLTVLPSAQLAPWMIRTLRVLLLIGSVSALYLLIRLVAWLILIGHGA